MDTDNTSTVCNNSFFEVRLESFDGPIDLLLHLVKSKELEIERISLAHVTAQYLECIEHMRRLDLDVAAEYLVVAATLLSIKASMLLDDPVEFEQVNEENLPDPHRELLERLREAEVYKQGASQLGQRSLLGFEVFGRKPTLKEYEDPEVEFVDHDAMLLGQAFRELLKRTGADENLLRFEIDSVSVADRMMGILDTIRSAGGKISFRKLIPDLTSRSALIGSFIAMLELCKRRVITIVQEVSYKDISINLTDQNIMEVPTEITVADEPDHKITANA